MVVLVLSCVVGQSLVTNSDNLNYGEDLNPTFPLKQICYLIIKLRGRDSDQSKDRKRF